LLAIRVLSERSLVHGCVQKSSFRPGRRQSGSRAARFQRQMLCLPQRALAFRHNGLVQRHEPHRQALSLKVICRAAPRPLMRSLHQPSPHRIVSSIAFPGVKTLKGYTSRVLARGRRREYPLPLPRTASTTRKITVNTVRWGHSCGPGLQLHRECHTPHYALRFVTS